MNNSYDRNEKPRRLLENPDAKLSMYISDISRMFQSRVKRRAEQNGIPAGFQIVLSELGRNDGISQLGLARLAKLSAPTVSVALTKMETDGLVRREPDPQDMRQMRVFLTEKGRESMLKVSAAFREADSLLAAGLTGEELETIMPLLRKLLVHYLEEEDKA